MKFNEFYKTDLEFLFNSLNGANDIILNILSENIDIPNNQKQILRKITKRLSLSINDILDLNIIINKTESG